MKINYNYELINDYLDGLLDQETSLKIGEYLQQNEEAHHIAKGILLLKKEFENDEVKIENYLEDLLNKQQALILKKSQPKHRVWLKIAAAIILMAITTLVLYQVSQPNIEEIILAELSEPYEGALVFRDAEITELSAGLSAYSKKEYNEASELLSQVKDVEAVFYHGLSQMYLGNYQRAAELFSHNILVKSRYVEHTRWFHALCAIKLKNIKTAKKLLVEISSTNNSFKHDQATKLLKLLED